MSVTGAYHLSYPSVLSGGLRPHGFPSVLQRLLEPATQRCEAAWQGALLQRFRKFDLRAGPFARRFPGFLVHALIAMDPVMSGHPVDAELSASTPVPVQPVAAALVYQIQEGLCQLGTVAT